MKNLIAQIRKARQSVVEVGKFKFTYRRPTDIEAAKLHKDGFNQYDIAAEYVVGWSGVTEADLVPSGGSDEVAFEEQLWREWCADNPDFWAVISDAVFAAYTRHVKESDEAKKT